MTFVITGGARGIGAATAALAARDGAAVVLADVLDDVGEATAAAIRDEGGRALFRHCDVSVQDDVDSLMAAAVDAFGGIDVVHNNAGVHEAMLADEISFEGMAVETFDRVQAINVRGTFLCSQSALPHLRRSPRPAIVNAGSTASFVASPGSLAYSTSKGAIALLTKNLAVALAPDRIRVNCYCPASVDTDMVRDVVASRQGSLPDAVRGADVLAQQARKHLVNRVGRADEIARLVCFLASDEASFVNGAVWLIDGGALAWRDTTEVLGMSDH